MGHTQRRTRRGLLAASVAAWSIAAACSSPEPQSGTNTNWVCATESRPDCRASGTPVCGSDWQDAQRLFTTCPRPDVFSPFLANCGAYRSVVTNGKDGYEAYFYDTSGRLVGHGTRNVVGVKCAAYDPSFAFPSEACTPISDSCGGDASVPGSDGSVPEGGVPDGRASDGGIISGDLQGIAATADGFVAVGGQGSALGAYRPLVLTSKDGRNWTVADVPRDSGFFTDVAFGNETIVAVGPGGDANSHILTKSPSGPWQAKLLGTNNESALFGNGVFLVTASVEPGATVSSDGVNWTGALISGSWFGFVDGSFVAFDSSAGTGTSGLRTSADGLTWSAQAPLPPSVVAVESLALVGNELLGFGFTACDGGFCPPSAWVMMSGPRGTPFSSLAVSHLTWTPTPAVVPAVVASSATRVVALAGGVWSTSLPLGSGPWQYADFPFLKDVAYRAGLFVGVGSHVDPEPLIATSTDGVTWEIVR